MNRRQMLPVVMLLLMAASDCRESEKTKKRWEGVDGGVVFRAECNEPARKCHISCVKRDASPACTRCCMDQDYVCNTGHNADFESCEGSR